MEGSKVASSCQIKEKNFTAYSSFGIALGRNHVHSKVSEIVLTAYRSLERTATGKVFVYGETGWAKGGRIRPHKTHRNGLSVDFFVPVVNDAGHSVTLPTNVTNKFGYNIDFDTDGKFETYSIDFETIAEHLYQLDIAAKALGAGLALVIIDPPYIEKLIATKHGDYIKSHINFMKGNAWVRHDEHYHVDFLVSCKSISLQ
ncbi:penicillin-insensitive murein endopeptidase [Undibacterium sp. RTI2.1]|uniref:replication initiation protein n=1 Tax=unclassified Undibacterium TaxID=2630295 RepID=UPI002AB35728|nr:MULTISPECIES: replication initiation protein [unclassified Undibacterium]MDY7540747.1 replication initiation protein [Undibacterium sp. 5I1]MEB0032190.1 penicillin-insensitive murein endopeptidase [Undibacterium sp. RTI2.1]MEB0118264.1 penicillin-insensitive murein endopeptidase [Undibacterium sp. RTI2.2]MEB0232632.1 penicillin-insensitive murein endopeptidase [Undibacterium sp. 10I3]MEB0259616.1 penicillin-insensitive murein endopeptidase [Undibacterium sp. 5I1]